MEAVKDNESERLVNTSWLDSEGYRAVMLLRLTSVKTVGVEQNCAGPNPFNFNTGSRCRA